MDSIKIDKRDLYFLLRDKYGLNIDMDDLSELPKNIQKDIELISKGVPLSYVIGFVEFLGSKIDLRFKPLIPRSETEFWVDSVFSRYELKGTILDIFCGSGCIGISILKRFQSAKVTFADISDKALSQTAFNLNLNKISKVCYGLIESDMFENLHGQKFDFIFANPPYIDRSSNKYDAESLRHEPREAIFAPNHGLFYIEKFLNEAPKYLADNGIIFLEFSFDQKDKVSELLRIYRFHAPPFFKDQNDIYRWVEIKTP